MHLIFGTINFGLNLVLAISLGNYFKWIKILLGLDKSVCIASVVM